MEDGTATSSRPPAPARQARPERKGGKMEGLKAQFLSLRSNNRASDEYENFDLPSLQVEKDRLTKAIAEGRAEEVSKRKMSALEGNLTAVNAKIASKSAAEAEKIERRSTVNSQISNSSEADEKEKTKFSLKKPFRNFLNKTKLLGKKSSSAPASSVSSPVPTDTNTASHTVPTSPDAEDKKDTVVVPLSPSKGSHSSSPYSTIKTQSSTGRSTGHSPLSTSKFTSLKGPKNKQMEEEDLSKMFAKFGGGHTIGRKNAKQLPMAAGHDRMNFALNKEDALAILSGLDTPGAGEVPALESSENEPEKYGTINARRVNITNFFASPNISVTNIDEIKATAVVIHAGVLAEYAVKTELNPGGLKRAKKEKKEIIGPDGKRKLQYQNEDENQCLCPFQGDNSQALFVICDGHADRNAAVSARNLLPERFYKRLQTTEKPYKSFAEAYTSTFLEVDEEMNSYQYEGCTATTVFCWTEKNGDRFVQAANVGDSSAILCRDGKVIPLTFDHKLKDNPQEQQRLRDMGVEVTDNQSRLHGLAITRTLGDHCLKRGNSITDKTGMIADPFVSDVTSIQSGDILIVASDGLWDVITFEKAAEMVANMTSSSEMVKKLMNHALGSTECRDNVTIICSVL